MSTLTANILAEFKKTVGDLNVLTDEASLVKYGRDWTHVPGKASAVVFPRSTAEVSALMKLCHKHKIAVVPSGGRTGLAGAAVATQGEVVISLEKMNKVIEVDSIGLSITAEAGVAIQTLQEKARDLGLFYPVDLASKGSCQLGGNIATNAGGLKLIRFGGTRDQVLGLEVVLANGEVLDLNFNLRKDNSGYDLKHLFISAEGTLGIITKATMKLTPPPRDPKLVCMGLNSFDHILEILRQCHLNSIPLTAFEFLTRDALDIVLKHHPEVRDPFAAKTRFYVLVEYENLSDKAEKAMEKLLEKAFGEEWVLDAMAATNSAEFRQLWGMRENISESVAVEAQVRKNDITIPIARLAHFYQKAEELLQQTPPELRMVLFGHIGDGNIHLNYLWPKSGDSQRFSEEVRKMEDKIFRLIVDLKGSISAEHGIGLTKKKDLTHTRTPEQIALMRAIKKVFDPDGILNPGKIFDL